MQFNYYRYTQNLKWQQMVCQNSIIEKAGFLSLRVTIRCAGNYQQITTQRPKLSGTDHCRWSKTAHTSLSAQWSWVCHEKLNIEHSAISTASHLLTIQIWFFQLLKCLLSELESSLCIPVGAPKFGCNSSRTKP